MDKDKLGMNIIQVGDVILSMDILRQQFYCDLSRCKGACCIEGDAGAPVTDDEDQAISDILPTLRPYLSPKALQVIDKQGTSYLDRDGERVTSIVDGKDCVFTCYDDQGICLCAIQKAHMEGKISVSKPISCSLYPIREKRFAGGLVGLNYNRWDICLCARRLGRKRGLPLYKYLRQPLISRFGKAWYEELERTADLLAQEGYL